MTHINFSNPGGLPLTQEILEHMQATYASISAPLAAALGRNVFLSGCVETGSMIGDGFVIIEGELLPFVGGVKYGYIKVEQVSTDALYNDGARKTVYTQRRAVLSDVAGVAISNFVRLKKLEEFRSLPTTVSSDYGDDSERALATIKAVFDAYNALSNQFPSGIISMWSGEISAIPQGWALCDGQNGTPDLRDRFVVGAGNEYSIGSTGGEKKHILTREELPAINALGTTQSSVVLPGQGGYMKKSVAGQDSTPGSYDRANSGVEPDVFNMFPFPLLGSGEAHENRPPYYALAYIIKL